MMLYLWFYIICVPWYWILFCYNIHIRTSHTLQHKSSILYIYLAVGLVVCWLTQLINRVEYVDLGLQQTNVIMQGKLFQRCTHLLYGSALPLGGNVNTRRMSKPDMGSIVHIKNQWNILGIGNYYVNYQNHQNLMLLTFSDTKRHRCIFSCLQIPPQRELVSICTQCIRKCNKLSLHYNLDLNHDTWYNHVTAGIYSI